MATLIAPSSSLSPEDETDIALIQSPLCGARAARKQALSTSSTQWDSIISKPCYFQIVSTFQCVSTATILQGAANDWHSGLLAATGWLTICLQWIATLSLCRVWFNNLLITRKTRSIYEMDLLTSIELLSLSRRPFRECRTSLSFFCQRFFRLTPQPFENLWSAAGRAADFRSGCPLAGDVFIRAFRSFSNQLRSIPNRFGQLTWRCMRLIWWGSEEARSRESGARGTTDNIANQKVGVSSNLSVFFGSQTTLDSTHWFKNKHSLE